MSKRLKKNIRNKTNRVIPVKTTILPLVSAMYSASREWFTLSAKDFNQYDCPEDNQ